MASTYTSRYRLELQGDGENDGTWGQKADVVFQLIDEAIGGYLSVSVAGGTDVTLTANNGSSDQSRKRMIRLTGLLTNNINVVVPTAEGYWFFNNQTTGAFNVTVKTAAGSGVVLNNDASGTNNWFDIIRCDGVSCFRLASLNQAAGAFGRTLYETASDSAARSALGLGTAALLSAGAVQASDAELTAIAGLTSAADRLPYFTGSGAAALATFTAAGRALVDDADATTQRATLGVISATSSAEGLSELATSGEVATGTDVARTVTPATLSANVLYQGKQTISIPAAGMMSRITSGPAAGAYETNSIQNLRTLDFDPSTPEYAQILIDMPKSWDKGAIDVLLDWTVASGSGVVKWGAAALFHRDSDPWTLAGPVAGALVVSLDTVAGAFFRHSVLLASITPGGTSSTDVSLTVEIRRQANDVADTCTVDALLVGVRILYTVNLKNDT